MMLAIMSDTIFFINAGCNDPELADVAVSVFQSLGISEWEERFSSNYPPDEHYFAGYAENAAVKVCDADWGRMPEYPFHLLVGKTTYRQGPGTIVTDPPKIATVLASCGFTVFIPRGAWGRLDWDGDGKVYAA